MKKDIIDNEGRVLGYSSTEYDDIKPGCFLLLSEHPKVRARELRVTFCHEDRLLVREINSQFLLDREYVEGCQFLVIYADNNHINMVREDAPEGVVKKISSIFFGK